MFWLEKKILFHHRLRVRNKVNRKDLLAMSFPKHYHRFINVGVQENLKLTNEQLNTFISDLDSVLPGYIRK